MYCIRVSEIASRRSRPPASSASLSETGGTLTLAMATGAGGGRGGGDVPPNAGAPAATPPHGDDYPPILTTAMAAELLSVHVEYLRRMVREGRIPAHRFPGGREIRFHRDELIAWVKAQPGHDRSPSADHGDEPAEQRTEQTGDA